MRYGYELAPKELFPEVGEAGREALDRLAKRWADRTGGNERGRQVLTRRAFQGTVKHIAKTLIVVHSLDVQGVETAH